MNGRLVGVLAVGLTCLAVSCETINDLRISAPPANPALAQRWWLETLNAMDLDTLAVYVGVSEQLRTRKANTTYCLTTVQQTKKGWSQQETQLPAPMPLPYLALAKSRLKDYQRQSKKAPSASRDGNVSAHPGPGCTPEEALDLWHQEETRLGWK